MTKPLIPPDGRPGRYWLRDRDGYETPMIWCPEDNGWYLTHKAPKWTPLCLAELRYTFADPHRIPTADEMRALYRVLADLDKDASETRRLRNLYNPNGAAHKQWGLVATAQERTAKDLRAALGITKP